MLQVQVPSFRRYVSDIVHNTYVFHTAMLDTLLLRTSKVFFGKVVVRATRTTVSILAPSKSHSSMGLCIVGVDGILSTFACCLLVAAKWICLRSSMYLYLSWEAVACSVASLVFTFVPFCLPKTGNKELPKPSRCANQHYGTITC